MANDDWRDSYDNWKLATPPEYEEEQSEESQIEEDAWRAGYEITHEEACAIVAERRKRERDAEAALNGGLSPLGQAIVQDADDIAF